MLKQTAVLAVLLASFTAAGAQEATLKDAYKGAFVVGAAINAAQIADQSRSDAIVKREFNAITPEDSLKWENIHPQPDKYDFSVPDQYVAFGEKNHMYIVGHVLVWHNQTPDWVFRDAQGNLLTRDAMLKRLHDHIATVVGRYKGRIKAWDVVNEAVDEDGSLRQTLWYKIIGEDYLAKAFQYAHEADPAAELNYNDYSLENPVKRAGALALIKKLKDEGVPVTTVGLQGHYSLDWPTSGQIDDTIDAFAKLGVKIAITELDIDVLPFPSKEQTADIKLSIRQDPALDPYKSGLPDAVQNRLAVRYGSLFGIFLKHRGVVERVTLWGVTDSESWRNNWPVTGRTSYPLLFDRARQPKPAFTAVIETAQKTAQ
jgi:endo-1,4-beta-xylanase